LNRERELISDADAVPISGRQYGRCVMRVPHQFGAVFRPWHAWTLFVREPGDLRVDHGLFGGHGPQREGEEP
jgi:hypothetical protein